ncbi:MAG: sialidase family protein [Planctomycetota bacterium]
MVKSLILIILLSLAVFSNVVLAGPIVVSSVEVWAGSAKHGITPTGSGTIADPYVYVIPDGMDLTDTGVIDMNDKYVTFDFSSGTGGLDIATGGYFDTTGSSRLSDPGRCTIILGLNNLTGAGDFKTVDIYKDSMRVSISGSGDVSVNSFYNRTNDAFAGVVDVDVGGSVNIGSIDTQDQASGGNDGGNVTVRGSDITIGDIDTRSLRTISSDRVSGSVLLEGLDSVGTNTLNNSINLYGTINTDAAAGIDGDVLVRGVVVTLESGFSSVTGDGFLDIYSGMVQYGKPASELFVDDSGGGYSAIHDVPWTGSGSVVNASNPSPAYYALSIDPNVVLSWTAGLCAIGHDVYLGTDFNDVNDATDPNVLPGRGRQEPNSYAVDSLLELGGTYFWRIDEVFCTNDGTTYKGVIWMFFVDEGLARNVEPHDGALNVAPSVELVWTPGVLANMHDVYLGTDFDEVNDANSTLAVDASVYKGRQEANAYDPVTLLLDTTYYWRIDEVGSSTFVKGDVWSFRTAKVNIIDNAVVYYEAGKFAAWPANNGLLWHWGDEEVVVGFSQADFCCQGGHNDCGESYNILARSLNGGMSWTTFDPDNFVGDSTGTIPCPGINFTHPDFAMRITDKEYYVSYDRCATWQGRYDMGTFGESTVDNWHETSRTDYIVNGPNDCLVCMSVKPFDGLFGTDRAYCVRTVDGGVTFQFQGWIVPPADPYRGVMPSTVRCSSTKLVSALRRRNMSESCDAWVDVYVSNDNGVNWSFLSKVGETGCNNGNPPALTRLSDGRLCCVYGNRSDMRMYMKYSEDEGSSWGPQITLRDDWADCAGDEQDLGYPRICQLANGRIICAYYWSTGERIENHIAATIWDTRDPGCRVDFHHFAKFSEYWRDSGCGVPDWCGGADLNQVNGVDGGLYGWPWTE